MHKIKEVLHHESSDDKHKDSSSSSSSSEKKMEHKEKRRSGEAESVTYSHPAQGVEHKHKEKHKDHKNSVEHKIEDKTTIDKTHTSKSSMEYREGVNPTAHRDVAEHKHVHAETAREQVEQPTMVKEKIREVEVHKVQPVIHREREQVEIRHIVEPHRIKETLPTEIQHVEKSIDVGTRREASTLETTRDAGHAPTLPESSRTHMGVEKQHTELPARVEETVHKKVIEHVHPVVYKEVLVPRVKEEVHHIHEKVKEAAVETFEVRDVVNHDTRGKMTEREFFDTFATSGVAVGQEHAHVHGSAGKVEIKDKTKVKTEKDRSLKKDKDRSHKKDKAIKKEGKVVKTETKHKEKVHIENTRDVHVAPPQDTTRTYAHGAPGVATTEPVMVSHFQNIGAHHVPAAVLAGHNTAYDAALAAPSKAQREEQIRMEKEADKRQQKLDSTTTKTHTVV